MEWLDSLQAWLETSGLYREYLSNMPVPLNNIYFDTFIMMALILYAGYRVIDFFRLDMTNHRIRKRQAALREESVANEMDLIKRERTARAESAEVSQLMTLAKMQMLNHIGNSLQTAGDGSKPQDNDLQAAVGAMLIKSMGEDPGVDGTVDETRGAQPQPVRALDEPEKKTAVDHAIDKMKDMKLSRFRKSQKDDVHEVEPDNMADAVVAHIAAEGLQELDVEPVKLPEPVSIEKPGDENCKPVFLSAEDIKLPPCDVREVEAAEAVTGEESNTDFPESDYSDVQPAVRVAVQQANNSFEAIMAQMIADKNLNTELEKRNREISEQVDKNRKKLNQV